MEKLLTLSVAAYNVQDYLAKTLDSCCKIRMFSCLEVLIVNDGSKDNTSAIGSVYEKKYPDIFRVINKENGGYGSTINSALSSSRGKYFKLLDGDDWVNPEGLDQLLAYLSKCDSDVVVSNCCTVYEGSDRVEDFNYADTMPEGAVFNYSDVKASFCMEMHLLAFKTEMLKVAKIKIQEKCFYTDIEFVIQAIIPSSTIEYCHAMVYCYRIGREGQSVSLEGYRKHNSDHEKVLKKLIALLKEMNKEDGAKVELIEKRVIDMAKNQFINYLRLKTSISAWKSLIDFDRGLKNDHPQIYNEMKGKVIKIIRGTRYLTYPVFSLYTIKKSK